MNLQNNVIGFRSYDIYERLEQKRLVRSVKNVKCIDFDEKLKSAMMLFLSELLNMDSFEQKHICFYIGTGNIFKQLRTLPFNAYLGHNRYIKTVCVCAAMVECEDSLFVNENIVDIDLTNKTPEMVLAEVRYFDKFKISGIADIVKLIEINNNIVNILKSA